MEDVGGLDVDDVDGEFEVIEVVVDVVGEAEDVLELVGEVEVDDNVGDDVLEVIGDFEGVDDDEVDVDDCVGEKEVNVVL